MLSSNCLLSACPQVSRCAPHRHALLPAPAPRPGGRGVVARRHPAATRVLPQVARRLLAWPLHYHVCTLFSVAFVHSCLGAHAQCLGMQWVAGQWRRVWNARRAAAGIAGQAYSASGVKVVCFLSWVFPLPFPASTPLEPLIAGETRPCCGSRILRALLAGPRLHRSVQGTLRPLQQPERRMKRESFSRSGGKTSAAPYWKPTSNTRLP